MKVLFVTNDAWFFNSHRLPIGERLAELGCEPVVTARKDETVPLIEGKGCRFIAWRIAPRGRSIVNELRTLCSLASIVRKERPRIIHLITVKSVIYGGIVARLFRVPACVYAISGIGTVFVNQSRKGRLLRLFLLPLYRFAIRHPNSILIFQNTADRAALVSAVGLKNSKTHVIRGSGVDLSLFPVTPEPAGVPIVTMASRLLKDKGVCEFIEAARMLRNQGVKAKFQLAGANIAEGNPAAFSRKEFEELQDQTDVELLGHCNDVADLFRHSNIVVLPSYREGLPKVLVEAGASARPVVTTDVPGCRDAVTPDQTALLVPHRRVPELAVAILRLLEDKNLREKFGAAGRELVENEMAINMIVDRHLEVYDRLGGKIPC